MARTPSKISVSREMLEKLSSDGGITPLEVVVEAMRIAWRHHRLEDAVSYAAIAMPFMHHRLATVDADDSRADVVKVVHLPIPAETIEEWQRRYLGDQAIVEAEVVRN
jgi:hypothetical protein